MPHHELAVASALRDWIADATGGVVTTLDRRVGGSSRETWFVDVEIPHQANQPLVLRRDSGDGPLSGTPLDLRREAEVYRALEHVPVPVPTVHAVSDAGDLVLLDRVSGRGDFAAVDPCEQSRVARDFIEILARLHQIDPDELDVPALMRPSCGAEHATFELDTWENIFATRVTSPEPLIRFAFDWLRRNAPETVPRTVLLQGDTGPGNFLFEDGRVTAVLDWEFAHFGDPMDDLAWLGLRDHYQPFGNLPELLRTYSDLASVPLDPNRILYYRALVLTRTSVACLAALDRPGQSQEPATYLTALQMFRRLLCLTLAELMSITLEPMELPEPGSPTQQSVLLDRLAADLTTVVVPTLTDPALCKRVQGMAALASHLLAVERSGPALRELELADMARLLGRRPATPEEGTAAVAELVATRGADRGPELLQYLARRAQRSMALWADALGPMAEKSFAPVAV